jgi:hypothetical protein
MSGSSTQKGHHANMIFTQAFKGLRSRVSVDAYASISAFFCLDSNYGFVSFRESVHRLEVRPCKLS